MVAPRHAAAGLVAAGGAALFASAFLHWIDHGPGRSLRGHDLIDALVALGDALPGMSSVRLTIVWYLVPALGAASWIALGLTGPASRATRVVAVAGAVVTALVLVGFVRLASVRALGPGAWCALAGATVLVVGAWLPSHRRADELA